MQRVGAIIQALMHRIPLEFRSKEMA